jgi:hypothetical protein
MALLYHQGTAGDMSRGARRVAIRQRQISLVYSQHGPRYYPPIAAPIGAYSRARKVGSR